jgi:hypothetical protein
VRRGLTFPDEVVPGFDDADLGRLPAERSVIFADSWVKSSRRLNRADSIACEPRWARW